MLHTGMGAVPQKAAADRQLCAAEAPADDKRKSFLMRELRS